jgi:hypothetical protein
MVILCGMSSCNEDDLINFQEIIEPVKDCFGKVVWTVNYKTTQELQYLINNSPFEKVLEKYDLKGNIIYNQWNYRNDFCRNSYLFSGHINLGDICINIDTLERLKRDFFNGFNSLLDFMKDNQVDGLFIHGKRFLFVYNDYLQYQGTPHEGLSGLRKPIELTSIEQYSDSSRYFSNVRPQKRDKYHFVDAYVRYYYSYPNSNHCLLGCENNQQLFQERERLRQSFRGYCYRVLKLSFEVDDLKNYIMNNELDEFMRNAFNQERILNDFYRYHKMQDREFNDRQTWDLIKI